MSIPLVSPLSKCRKSTNRELHAELARALRHPAQLARVPKYIVQHRLCHWPFSTAVCQYAVAWSVPAHYDTLERQIRRLAPSARCVRSHERTAPGSPVYFLCVYPNSARSVTVSPNATCRRPVVQATPYSRFNLKVKLVHS